MTTGRHPRLDPADRAPDTAPEIDSVTSVALEDLPDEPAPPITAHSTAARERLARGSGDRPPVGERPPNLRLAELETWREEVDGWRLKLSGIGDSNGRLGEMDRRIAASAAYIVDDKRRRAKVLAAIFSAAAIAGGGIYTVLEARDAATARATEIRVRLEHLERDLYRKETDR